MCAGRQERSSVWCSDRWTWQLRYRNTRHDRVGTRTYITKSHTALQKLQRLSVFVCVCAEADSDAPSCSTVSWRKKDRLSILFIVTQQDTKRLFLHSNTPAGACRSCKRVSERVFVSACSSEACAFFDTSVSTTSIHVICLCVSITTHECIVSGLGFYLRVNRTGPQRMSTHHIANPTQRRKQFYLSFPLRFFFSSFCLPYPPTVLLPFVFIWQLSTALCFGSQSDVINCEWCSTNLSWPRTYTQN